MITLENHQLNIQIQEPGSSYRRSRFDWGGICQQITLDGAADSGYTFCSQEASDDEPGTEGVGLSDEFGITTPIGYEQTEVGGWFPKIGVGFLQKTSAAPYDFFSDYPIRAVPIHVEKTGDHQVTFLQLSQTFNGWGWRLRKTYVVDGDSLTIAYELENTGEQAFATEQYNHNFVAIDGETIGPDYELQTSFPLDFELVDGGIQVDGNVLKLMEVPPQYIYATQSDCAGLQNVWWRLLHRPSGHGLRVCGSFPLQKFALWAKDYVISPECFIWIDMQPGETQTWQREYQFF
jgi:hypothetical protein